MAKKKTKKPRQRSVITKQIEKANQQLEKMDRRLSKLQGIKDRLSYVSNPSERQRALLNESVDEWVAEYREANEADTDGIDFEALHVDFLMLDEAQNMKNLWPVERREGGVPKYLGAISEGSDRAMAFAIRSFLVQRETGGSGVALLSATPAKNSPLEFFTMLGLVDHYCWTRRSIYDADGFIDRYLRLAMQSVLKPDGTLENRSAVVGFKSLNDLRDLVFRYGDFKDAKDVGLVLPESKQDRIFVPMNEEQRDKYSRYRQEYEDLVTSRMSGSDRYRALAILQKMSLVSLHPELDEPPSLGRVDAKGKLQKKWTWANADKVRNPESPKLLEAARLVLQKPECGHIFFVENVPVHKWLKNVLVAQGIPEERIAILNADRAPKALQRQEIAEAFNGTPAIYDTETGALLQEAIPPKYDIVICNSVAYEGIDLQIRTCRVYHLDLPWEPATVQQRNGRAVRQGNMQAVIEVYYLLAEKSMDGVRLGLITGKLRWMSDILKGADRETANPAAGMDLSQEDMLLMLADDPEAARRAMAEIQIKNDIDRRRQAASRAWQRVGDLLSYQRMAITREEELERELARRNAEETIAYLRMVSPQIWPWAFLLDLLQGGANATTIGLTIPDLDGASQYTSRAVWDGLMLVAPEDRFVFFARVGGGSFSFRWDGSPLWERPEYGRLPPELVNAFALAPPSSYQQPAVDDSGRWRPALARAISSLSLSGIAPLRLSEAPDVWRVGVWEEFGTQIVDAIARYDVVAPVRSGATVEFQPITKGAISSVIAPTDAGFVEFVTRIRSGRHRYGQTQEQVKQWWGRDFPRGVADDREIVRLANDDGKVGEYRLEMAGQNGFSAAQVADGAYRAANLVRGQLLGPTYASFDHAKLAARWLGSMSGEPGQFGLDGRGEHLLTWLAMQTDLPTLSGLNHEYENGTAE